MSTNKLHTIKETGFKVDKDYFALLEDTILSEVKLQKLTTKSGYTVPDTYFNSLEDKIINTVNKTETKTINLFNWRKAVYITAVAASLILMINVFFNNNNNTVTIDNIETASIENFIINQDLETTEFASLFTKEDLQDVKLINDSYTSETIENFVFDNLEIEDIITN